MQDREQRLVYANEAAAETLGFPSVDALLGAAPQDLVSLADYYNEDGSPLTPEQYPSRRVLAGEEVGPQTVRVINRATGEERWRVNKPRGVLDARGETRLVVTVIEDITDQKRAELAQRLLARGGQALSSSLNYERTLQEVADLAVPSLADWCGVSMPDRHGLIAQVAVAHSDPEKVAFARSYSRALPEPHERRGRLGAGAARRPLAADPRDPRRAARGGGPGSRAARAAAQHRHALGDQRADDGGVGEADRRHLVHQRRVRPGLHRGRARAVRGARAAGGDRGRERPPLHRALADRPHPPARAAAARAAGDPGLLAVGAVPARGRGELGRRRLLRRVRGPRRLGGGGRRRRRPRRAGGGADRVRPPRVPHRGAAARRPARRRRLPQPAALRARRARRCARSAACTCGRAARTPRRPSCAAVTRCPTRCARPAPRSRSAASGRCSARGPTGSGRARRRRSRPATCSCSTRTA